jgi:hypothetical protein
LEFLFTIKKVNMKALNLAIIAASIVVLTGSCKSTGMQALTQGKYYTACLQAVDKLRSSPANEKATIALTQAYPLAVSYTEKETERLLKALADANRYQKVFELYAAMNRIAVEISRCPAALLIIPNANYYNSQLEAARSMAAEESYLLAVNHLTIGTRAAARQAYWQFQKTNSIIAGYKDVATKLPQAKWMATLKVVLEQLPVGGQHQVSADFFQAKVFEYLSTNVRNEFIQLFSPEEARDISLHPDQIIRLNFLNFAVGQVRESRNSYEVKRDSVKTGTYKDGNGVLHDVYGTVKATVTNRKVEVSSSGTLHALIIDGQTNAVLLQQRFPGTFVWANSYTMFNGDERALSKKELERCRRTAYSPPPPPQEMFVQLTVPMFNSLAQLLKNYYRKY